MRFGNIWEKTDYGQLFFDPSNRGPFTLNILFNVLINWAFIIGISLSLIYVIISGIKFITSVGNPEKFEGAKQTLINAIIGLLIVVLFSTIINIILGLLGLPTVQTILNP